MIKRFCKKLLISVLVVLMITMLLPFSVIPVSADDGNKITDSTPRILSGTYTDQLIEIEPDVTAYVTLNSVTMNNSSILIKSGATLNLTVSGYNEITGWILFAAIEVLSGATLNITEESTGELWAVGGDYAAGIGSGYNGVAKPSSLGTINIHGGTIHAVGGNGSGSDLDGDFFGGAGIGTGSFESAGDDDVYQINCGDITITGGTVTAVGKGGAAGIGGASFSDLIGTVSISGGHVVAQPGTDWDTAIGSGYFEYYTSVYGGTINISGGTVRCTNDSFQPDYQTYQLGYESTIEITGGSIEASFDTYQYKIKMRMPLGLRRISVESMTIKVGSLIYSGYGTEDIISTPTNAAYNGYIYLYLDAPSTNLTVDIVGRTTTNGTVNYHYYGINSSGTLKMDQSPLSVTDMQTIYSTGSAISPDTSGGDGPGAVSYSYTGRAETAYGPSTAAPNSIGNYTVTATKAADDTYYAATAAYNFSILPSLTVEDIPDQTYTGAEIRPDVTVKDGSSILDGATDYSVDYDDNVQAGTATVAVTGTGIYSGSSATQTFTIIPQEGSLTVAPIDNQTYTGSAVTPAVTVTDENGLTLSSQDYEATYANHTDAGTATVTVTGKRNYTNTSTGSRAFTIVPKQSALTIAVISSQTYSGSAITPAVTVTDADGLTLSTDDYDVTYTDHTDAGTATVTVTGKRNYTNTSTGSRTFTIAPKHSALTIAAIPAQTYSGSPMTPAITVTDADGLTLNSEDYEIAYNNHTNAGTASVLAIGKRNYTNSSMGVGVFTIVPKQSALTVATIDSQSYTGSPVTPAITVTDADGRTLSSQEYKAVYGSNTSVGMASVIVTGQLNYTGTSMGTQTFIIGARQSALTVAPIVNQTYTGSPVTPAVTVTDASGLTLSSLDYDIAYSSNTDAGTATVTVTGSRNYATTSMGSRTFTISPKSSVLTVAPVGNQAYSGSPLTPAVAVTDADGLTLDSRDYTATYTNNTNAGTATVEVAGKRNYTGVSTGTAQFSILPGSGFTVTPVADQVYSGSAIEPALTVKDGHGKTLTAGTDYTLSFAGNVNAGTATATVTGKGNYTGSLGIQFIVAKRPVSLHMSASGSRYALDDVTLTAGIQNAVNLPAGTVTFKAGDEVIAANVPVAFENGVYTAKTVWSAVPEGTYALTAAYVQASSDNYTSAQTATLTEFSVTKRNQTGFTGGTVSKTLGDSPFTVSASGGQGSGAVRYTVASGGDCVTLSGDRVTLLKAGQAVITAAKSGDAQYKSTSASVIINIGKAAASIKTLPSASAITGSGPLSSSVLTGGQGSVSGTFRWKTPDAAVIATGDYDVIFTPDDTANYTACSGKVPVTVTSASEEEKTVFNPETDIEVDISDVILPDDVEDITVDIDEIAASDGQTANTVKDLLLGIDDLKNADNFALYDLTLLDQNDAPIPQVNGRLTIKIAVPDGMGSQLRVFRFDEATNRLVEVEAAVKDSYIVINTSQPGLFTVVEVPERPLTWLWLIVAAVILCIGVIVFLRKKRRS